MNQQFTSVASNNWHVLCVTSGTEEEGTKLKRKTAGIVRDAVAAATAAPSIDVSPAGATPPSRRWGSSDQQQKVSGLQQGGGEGASTR